MKSTQNIQTKDLVVHILREQILPDDLKSGEELTQEDVAEKLGISRISIREALQALIQEDFLVRMCNRHVCMPRTERMQMLESFHIMAVVEAEILGMLDERAVQVLSTHINETVKILEEGSEGRGRQMGSEYHWPVSGLLDNPYLQQTLKKLQEDYLSYILLKLPLIHGDRVARSRRLGDAVKEIGGPGIKDALLEHFEYLVDSLLDRTAALQEERMQQMKIVVLDGYAENPGDLTWNEISAMGDLTVHGRTPADDKGEIIRRTGDAQVTYTNKVPLDRAVLNACPSIAFVCLLATGYNVVDTGCARGKGVPVSNIPTYGIDSVEQFAISLLLEICHYIGHHDRTVKGGRWEKNADRYFWDYPLIELAGKTMGITGFSRIGQKTGTIAKTLGMNISTYGQYPNDAGRVIAAYMDLDTLLGNSDVIALHCPLSPETERIINRRGIEKMKDGIIIPNNSRGPLIHQQNLTEASNSGKVFAAGLDMVDTEPIRGDNPLLKTKSYIVTPHISWAPGETRQCITDMAVGNPKAFLAGKPVNVVNGGQRIQEALMHAGIERFTTICAVIVSDCL